MRLDVDEARRHGKAFGVNDGRTICRDGWRDLRDMAVTHQQVGFDAGIVGAVENKTAADEDVS
jgi:hypothetical protein